MALFLYIKFMEIFTLGGAVFLVSFVLFKVSAFRKTKANESWSKLALVGVVDYLVLVAGTLGHRHIIYDNLFNGSWLTKRFYQ